MIACDMLTKNLINKQFILISIIILLTSHFTMSEDLVVEIDNPKFSEKGLNDKIYEIKAKKGLKSEEELELFTVEGKFKTKKDGKWIYLKADFGNFSQKLNFIELKKNIIFYTDDGEKFRSNHATFDIKNDVIKLEENVSHESIDGKIVSDTSEISENFNKIVYTGNVETIINTNN